MQPGDVPTQQSVRDTLFAQPLGAVEQFCFDQTVVDVFPDMLARSIPGYHSIISQTGLLASRFAQPDTHLFDLGCSLGATTLSMHHSLGKRIGAHDNLAGCTIHGVDNSIAMIEQCAKVIELNTGSKPLIEFGSAEPHADFKCDNTANQQRKSPVEIELHCANMQHIKIHTASVVALNFTLQFIPVEQRDQLLNNIAAGQVSGGALILSEKIAFADPVLHQLHIEMYHAFKRANGYSELEISQKRSALENVLIPDTLETHNTRLAAAGFHQCSTWFQCFNFASIIAIKG